MLHDRRPGSRWAGYDGAGDIEEYTRGYVSYFDLTLPLALPRADWVVSLEVAEHVPIAHEQMREWPFLKPRDPVMCQVLNRCLFDACWNPLCVQSSATYMHTIAAASCCRGLATVGTSMSTGAQMSTWWRSSSRLGIGTIGRRRMPCGGLHTVHVWRRIGRIAYMVGSRVRLWSSTGARALPVACSIETLGCHAHAIATAQV